MNRSILLAGGSGFIGCHLVRALTRAGAACAVADRAESPGLPNGTEFHRTSLSDSARLHGALLGHDTLIYLAHESSAAPVAEQSEANLFLNLATFQAVLGAAVDAGISSVVLFSSGGAVYGRTEPHPIGEEAQARPTSVYGKTKLAMEQALNEVSKRTGLSGLVLRPSNAYGPGQNFQGQQGIISVGLARIAQDEAITIYGNGSAIKDYLFIDDLCSAVVALLRCKASGVFNVGSGRGIPLSDLLDWLGSIVGRTPHLNFEPPIPGDVHYNVLDCSKIKEVAGWQTTVPLKEGIKRTWEWIRPRLPR